MTTAEGVYNMVENLLRNEPQSTFVWDVYPAIASAVAAKMAIDTVRPIAKAACDTLSHS